MTVSSTSNRASYAGDGATTAFAFTHFYVTPQDFIIAKFNTVTKAITALVFGVDYTVAGVADSNGVYSNGGTINTIVAPAVGEDIMIVRKVSEIQPFHPTQNASANPAQNELAYDKLTLMVQYLNDQIDRAVKIPDAFIGAFELYLPTDFFGTPGASLILDPTGAFFITGPTASAIADAEANAIAAAASAAAAAASAAATAALTPTMTAFNTAGGDVPQNLPAANLNNGKIVGYINKSFGSIHKVNVGTTGGDTINSQAGDVLGAGEVGQYWSDGISNWIKIN